MSDALREQIRLLSLWESKNFSSSRLILATEMARENGAEEIKGSL